MGEAVKLRPCPFCGSKKLKIESKGTDVRHRYVRKLTVSVRCNRCFARGGTVSGEVPDYMGGVAKSDKLTSIAALNERAAEKWNRRKADGQAEREVGRTD